MFFQTTKYLMIFFIFGLMFNLSIALSKSNTINYYGYMTNSQGFPINKTIKMKFCIYNSRNVVKWTRERFVTISDGQFDVILGKRFILKQEYFNNEHYILLSIKCGGNYYQIGLKNKLESNFFHLFNNINIYKHIFLDSNKDVYALELKNNNLLTHSNTNEIKKNEAYKIAKGFIYFKSELENLRLEWKNTFISDCTPFYSSNGMLLAYEFEVKTHSNEPKGYIIVNAIKGFGSIKKYSSSGLSLSKSLRLSLSQFLHSCINGIDTDIQNSSLEYKFFTSMNHPSCAVGFRNVQNSGSINKDINILKENAWYIINQNIDHMSLTSYSHNLNVNEECKQYHSITIENENKFRNLLMNKDKLLNEKPIPIRVGRIGKGKSEFNNFYQTRDNWLSPYPEEFCQSSMTGCAPIALAMVLEYWDRRGFNNIVSDLIGNTNNDVKDLDVWLMLHAIRVTIGTDCTGNTDMIDAPNIKYYLVNKGYNFRVGIRINYEYIWRNIMININNQHPPVLRYRMKNGAAHYVVVYEYVQYPLKYYYLNEISVKTGWKSSTEETYKFFDMNGTSLLYLFPY